MRRALLPLLLIAAGILSGCSLLSLYPAGVRGLPAQESWAALPVGEWLGEGRGEPEAVAICRPPECGPAMAVGVIRLTGAGAEAAQAVLEDPKPLARALRDMKGRKLQVQTDVVVRHLRDGPFEGFTIKLGRKDNALRPVLGAALGRRFGQDLRVVLVIGEDAEAVETTALHVAAEHLGT
jgi:hypothetical protein